MKIPDPFKPLEGGKLHKLDKDVVRKQIGAGGLFYAKLPSSGEDFTQSVKDDVFARAKMQAVIEAVRQVAISQWIEGSDQGIEWHGCLGGAEGVLLERLASEIVVEVMAQVTVDVIAAK